MRELPFHDETLHFEGRDVFTVESRHMLRRGAGVPVAGNLVIFINWNLVQMLALDTFVVGDRLGDCSSKCCAL